MRRLRGAPLAPTSDEIPDTQPPSSQGWLHSCYGMTSAALLRWRRNGIVTSLASEARRRWLNWPAEAGTQTATVAQDGIRCCVPGSGVHSSPPTSQVGCGPQPRSLGSRGVHHVPPVQLCCCLLGGLMASWNCCQGDCLGLSLCGPLLHGYRKMNRWRHRGGTPKVFRRVGWAQLRIG